MFIFKPTRKLELVAISIASNNGASAAAPIKRSICIGGGQKTEKYPSALTPHVQLDLVTEPTADAPAPCTSSLK